MFLSKSLEELEILANKKIQDIQFLINVKNAFF